MRDDREVAEEIVTRLNEKKRLFKEFEAVSEQMMTDSADGIDQMVECVEQREQLKTQIDELDQRIRETAGQSADGEAMLRASKNLCDFATLKEAYREIYSAGQEIFGIISRIQNMDPQIRKNMDTMMEELQRRIKQNKKNAKFTGYINNMGLKPSTGVLYDKKR